ncbi:MAG: FtsQ-type POTRA domain-containing protein [Eubacteriales bacterium]|nr:FtsQ-type POTRA domain-containing protein [Eubacteriales bacterium]
MAAKNNFRLMAGGKGKSLSTGKKKKGGGFKMLLAGILIAILCLLTGILVFIMNRYKVENIVVEGNVHYSREEIIGMVMTDRLSYNSLYLSFKYRDKEIKNIPFIETMSVKVGAPDTITITVYEKSVAGYVEYMGRYMYFDRGGVVVESSETKTQGIPQVIGVNFDHVILYEPLPVENNDIFQQILSITQMLDKYELVTDKIYFNESYEITLYFDQVRVRLGSDNLEEKIMRLPYILPELAGKSGIVRMENYSDESENITFESDG